MISLDSALYGLAGGILIGSGSLAASIATGKIPGISGVFGRLLQGKAGDGSWRAVFLCGLIGGATLAFALSERAALYRAAHSLSFLAAAGFLVGLGTRIGGGCTSGHGICGIGLGAKDSLIATLLFMGAGMVTVFLVKQYGGGPP